MRILDRTNRKLGNQLVQDKLKLKSKLKSFLKNNECKVDQQIAELKLSNIEETITHELASSNAEAVKEYVGNMETLDGNFSQLGLWKLKKKLCPLKSDPPMAKLDNNGNLVTTPEALKNLYLETYRTRLKHRDMDRKYMDIFFLKSELWQIRCQNLKQIKTKPWTMNELENVLKNLKNNKSMDPNGMINETFKKG